MAITTTTYRHTPLETMSKIKQKVFNVYRHSFGDTIPREMMDNMDVDYWMDPLTTNLLVKFSFFLSGQETVVETETIDHKNTPEVNMKRRTKYKKIPATCWGMFVLTYFPKWSLKYIKVKYRKIPFTVDAYTYKYTTKKYAKTITCTPYVPVKDKSLTSFVTHEYTL